jgi:hypothetical protein
MFRTNTPHNPIQTNCKEEPENICRTSDVSADFRDAGGGKKRQSYPVTGREGPLGCETSRLPHFLDNRLTDGGEFVSPPRRPPFTPRKIPGTHLLEAETTPEGLGQLKNPMTSSGIEPATSGL